MRGLARCIACTMIIAAIAPRLLAATGGASGRHGTWEAAVQNRLLKAIVSYDAAGKKQAATKLGPRPAAWPRLAKELRQVRLVGLRFPGKSSRRRFIIEGDCIGVARPAAAHHAGMSYIAWRDGRRFAILADFDSHALCYSFASPARKFSALLLGQGTTRVTNKPILIWTAHGGVGQLSRMRVLHSPDGKKGRWTLRMQMGFAFFSKRPAGIRPGIANLLKMFAHAPAGSLWTQQGPCIGLLRPRLPSGHHFGWLSIITSIGNEAEAPGLLFTSGFVGRKATGGYLSAAFSLQAAPLRAGGGPAMPARRTAPASMRGVWVHHVSAAFFLKMFRIADIVAAASVNPDRRERYILSRFQSLNKCPRAVTSFLAWVGGDVPRWYRHHGEGRLRRLCLAALITR